MLWYGEDGKIRELASLGVPAERIVDTSGAGDVFHGAYVWSYLNRPELPWSEHFTFARAASAPDPASGQRGGAARRGRC